jgi:glycosyltransferase involved in cell wall biosynthesis
MPVWKPDREFFHAAVTSIVAQSLAELELVIVEDPSGCPTAEWVRQLGDPRIRYYASAERTGLVRQLNDGLARSSAPLVARMDADDVCHPERLEKQVALLDEQPDVSVVGSQIKVIDAHGQMVGYRKYPQTHAEIIHAMSRFNPLAHPSVMFRKNVVTDVSGYRDVVERRGAILWCQDYELWSRLAAKGIRFANHRDALLSYRVHTGQVKSTNVRSVIRATLAVKRQYWRDSMDWPARARMLAERLLLFLPPKMVVAMFERLEFRKAAESVTRDDS